jgi:hypothetical protein
MRSLIATIFLAPFLARAVVGWNGGAAADSVTFFQSGGLGAPRFGDGSSMALIAEVDSSGNLISAPVSLSDYLAGIVTSLDSNSFLVVNGTLYSKGLLGGGSYVSLSTNANFVFTNGNRIVLGVVPSVQSFSLTAYGYSSGPLTPPGPAPSLQYSQDGGNSWFDLTRVSDLTNAALISIYASDTNATASSAKVFSYVNPSAVGATYDLTQNPVLVTQTTNAASAVSVTGANIIAAAQAAKWAQYSASQPVNLAGNGETLNGTWTISTPTNALIFSANGSPVLTITAGAAYGTAPNMQSITLAGTNATFKLISPNPPTIQVETNLNTPGTWSTLASQSNWQSGGFWYVAATVNPATNCFFRAYCLGTSATPNKAIFNAQVNAGGVTTNLQFSFGTRTNTLCFTNGILMNVTSP